MFPPQMLFSPSGTPITYAMTSILSFGKGSFGSLPQGGGSSKRMRTVTGERLQSQDL